MVATLVPELRGGGIACGAGHGRPEHAPGGRADLRTFERRPVRPELQRPYNQVVGDRPRPPCTRSWRSCAGPGRHRPGARPPGGGRPGRAGRVGAAPRRSCTPCTGTCASTPTSTAASRARTGRVQRRVRSPSSTGRRSGCAPRRSTSCHWPSRRRLRSACRAGGTRSCWPASPGSRARTWPPGSAGRPGCRWCWPARSQASTSPPSCAPGWPRDAALAQHADVRFFLDDVAPLLDGDRVRWVGWGGRRDQGAAVTACGARRWPPTVGPSPGDRPVVEALAEVFRVVATAAGLLPSLVRHGGRGSSPRPSRTWPSGCCGSASSTPRSAAGRPGPDFSPAVMARPLPGACTSRWPAAAGSPAAFRSRTSRRGRHSQAKPRGRTVTGRGEARSTFIASSPMNTRCGCASSLAAQTSSSPGSHSAAASAAGHVVSLGDLRLRLDARSTPTPAVRPVRGRP